MNDQTYSIILTFLICILVIIFAGLIIIGIYYFNSQRKKLKNLNIELESVKETLSSTGGMELHEIRNSIDELSNKKTQALAEMKTIYDLWEKRKEELSQQEKGIIAEIELKKKEIIELDDEILLQSFGFYKPKYSMQNSEEFKKRLDQIRDMQESMVKSGHAASGAINWTLNNDKKEGERMIKDYVKLILRSFNNECDASIINVKFSNVLAIKSKISKAFDVLNKLGKRMTISISTDYLNLKLEELYLFHEYQQAKQKEKEEQKRIREQMREEAKAQKEYEDMKLKLDKEGQHFTNALAEIEEKMKYVKTNEDKELLQEEKRNIQERLIEVEKDKQDVINRENNTRAGYVYIISNVGSFGDNIYKIGVTRRLDPTERVDELSDASVPFNFDIHATIFSDDAPALENAIHKAFDRRRLNWINLRREFFNVTLEEIVEVVKNNFSKPIEVIKIPDAEEFRESIKLKSMQTA